MKPHKIKFKRPFAEGFEQLVNALLAPEVQHTDDDKLLLAALVEIKDRLAVKVITNAQEQYSLKLSPVQSIAIRMLYNDYVKDPTTYMGNALLKISNESHQKF